MTLQEMASRLIGRTVVAVEANGWVDDPNYPECDETTLRFSDGTALVLDGVWHNDSTAGVGLELLDGVHLKTVADDANPHYVSPNVRQDSDQPVASVGEGKWGNPATWDWYRVADVASKMSFNLPDGPRHNTMYMNCPFDHNAGADEPVIVV